MNKRNGFTIVELLAVIVILGVIMTMGTISVLKIIDKSKKDVGNYTREQIEEAATTFTLNTDFKDERFNYISTCNIHIFVGDRDYGSSLPSGIGEDQITQVQCILSGKQKIVATLGVYFPEMVDKCTFENASESDTEGMAAEISIINSVNDIVVDKIEGISCEG